MEQVKQIKNSFVSPVLASCGVDYSDDVVHEYELHDFVTQGPSGEPEDFVVEKKPIETDCYHLNKVISVRARGSDLKSIIARIKATGDATLLEQRQVIYGDATKQPSNLSDALDEGVKTSQFLDSLSEEEKNRLMKLAKMSDEDFTAYIKSEVDKSKPSEIVRTSVEEEKGDK